MGSFLSVHVNFSSSRGFGEFGPERHEMLRPGSGRTSWRRARGQGDAFPGACPLHGATCTRPTQHIGAVWSTASQTTRHARRQRDRSGTVLSFVLFFFPHLPYCFDFRKALDWEPEDVIFSAPSVPYQSCDLWQSLSLGFLTRDSQLIPRFLLGPSGEPAGDDTLCPCVVEGVAPRKKEFVVVIRTPWPLS